MQDNEGRTQLKAMHLMSRRGEVTLKQGTENNCCQNKTGNMTWIVLVHWIKLLMKL